MDFHGFTAAEMLELLERTWSSRVWHGLRRVRIIHGRGVILGSELRRWSEEKGIEWSPENGNPGATILFPSRRILPTESSGNRPLAAPLRIKRREVSIALRARPPSPEPNADDSELFVREMKRLEAAETRAFDQRKRFF